MSARLGPIHNWLYNQIQIIDKRNSYLLSGNYDLVEKFDFSLEGVDISEALNGQHIHPGLESLIINVQSLEVKILEELIKNEDFESLEEKYYLHGKKIASEYGQRAEDLSGIVKILKDLFLERMPCDRLTTIESSEEKVEIIRNSKLHTEFWNDSEISIETMHKFYSAWIRGVLAFVNPNVEYKRVVNVETYIDVIEK